MIQLDLGVVVVVLTMGVVVVTLAAGVLVGLVLRAQAVRAKEQQATLLGIVERLRPGAAMEQAKAEAVRATSTPGPPDPAIEARANELQRRAEAIRVEEKAGFPGFIAEGRAAMRLADLDPDDPADVVGFNARYEGNV